MASKGKKLSKKEIRTAAGKQRKREQRTAVAEASQGAETLDPGATTTSGECWMWMCGVVDLTLPSLRFAAPRARPKAGVRRGRGRGREAARVMTQRRVYTVCVWFAFWCFVCSAWLLWLSRFFNVGKFFDEYFFTS